MLDSPPPYDPLPDPLTAHLTTHLASLPSLIRTSQQSHHRDRLARDLSLTTLLTPPITSLLHAFATAPTLPQLAELTLVPAAAVPPEWIFASPVDGGSRKGDEIRRLERVEVDKEVMEELFPAGAEDRDGESRPRYQREGEFDEWGRWGDDTDGGPSAPPSHLWFADEALAIRLAKLLQPAAPRAPPPPPAPEPPATTRASKWGALFKSPDPLEPVRRAPRQVFEKGGEEGQGEEGMSMTVRAEEVTFRRESEMGIWESRSGFGVVVRVRRR